MKAIVCTACGGPDVLKLEEVEKPRLKKRHVWLASALKTVKRVHEPEPGLAA